MESIYAEGPAIVAALFLLVLLCTIVRGIWLTSREMYADWDARRISRGLDR